MGVVGVLGLTGVIGLTGVLGVMGVLEGTPARRAHVRTTSNILVAAQKTGRSRPPPHEPRGVCPKGCKQGIPYFQVDESIFGLSFTQLHAFATVLSSRIFGHEKEENRGEISFCCCFKKCVFVADGAILAILFRFSPWSPLLGVRTQKA